MRVKGVIANVFNVDEFKETRLLIEVSAIDEHEDLRSDRIDFSDEFFDGSFDDESLQIIHFFDCFTDVYSDGVIAF